MSIRDELTELIDRTTNTHDNKVHDAWLTDLVDAILARYAVIELPERTDDRWVDGNEGCEMSGWEIETGPHYVSVFHPNEIEISYHGEPDEPVRPAYARALAAALLAAANRAETQA
jgi:hypothetical protein